MQARNVNGFSAAEVDDALRGAIVGQVKYRPRFVILDSENQVLRETTNVLSGSVRNRAQDQIKRTLECLIREANIVATDYSDMVVEDGPLFYWKLGESSGGTAADSSGNARNGSYTSVSYSGENLLAGVPGETSITFNGTSSNVTIANAAWMNVANVSLEAWIRPSVTGTVQEIFCRDTGNNGWQFRIQENGTLAFLFWNGASYDIFISTVDVTDGQPHHVAVTYDGAFIILYVDSIQVLKTAESSTFPTPALAIFIGVTEAGTLWYTGRMQKLAMYARALSAQEIREHWQQGSGDLAEIDYTRDRLKIYIAVRMNRNGDDGTPWAEFPLGVFLLSAPDRDMVATGISRQVQGYDQTVILSQDAVTARYVILGGQNYITEVSTLLVSASLDTTGYQLTATSLTLPATRSWPIGTTKLQIINDLLTAINYRLFRFNSDGVGVAEPDVLPKNRGVDYAYSTDEFSVMSPNMKYTVDLFNVYNVVVLSSTQPKRSTITATVTNNLFSSPTSVRRREGRRVVYADDNFDAADQSSITAAAQNMLTRFSQVAEVWQFATTAHPFHEDEDILTLTDVTGLYKFNVSGNYMESEWVLPFTDLTTGEMTHVCQRIVAVA